MKLTPKVRKTLDFAIRFVIAILAVSYIVFRFYNLQAGQLNAFIETVIYNNNFIWLSNLLLVLMIINWGVEAMKWRLIVKQVETVTYLRAFRAVLGGITVSVFTPNRVGEFIGRVFILKTPNPIKPIMLTIVGSFSQLMVTIIFGTVAYMVFAQQYLVHSMNYTAWVVYGFSIVLLAVSIAMLFVFFNVSVLHRISSFCAQKISNTIKSTIEVIASCPKLLLLKVISLSAFRYLVFSTQFYICIIMMGLNFEVMKCLVVIPVIYLALSAIPTIALTELGVRGSVSVFTFGILAGSNGLDAGMALAVVSASTLVWIVNIAIPALAGVFVIFRLNFFRR